MIAYSHRVPGFANEWAMINPDATGDATLRDGAARQWSPDGNKILFNRFPPSATPTSTSSTWTGP